MEWRDINKTTPPIGVIWVLIKGRKELDGRDTEIRKMVHLVGKEYRTLDYAMGIYLQDDLPEFETIIAWMPEDEMEFPDWIEEQLYEKKTHKRKT